MNFAQLRLLFSEVNKTSSFQHYVYHLKFKNLQLFSLFSIGLGWGSAESEKTATHAIFFLDLFHLPGKFDDCSMLTKKAEVFCLQTVFTDWTDQLDLSLITTQHVFKRNVFLGSTLSLNYVKLF
jgi:hypothetical protein